MSLASALLDEYASAGTQQPWPRVVVDADGWRRIVATLAGHAATLISLWCDGSAVHLSLYEENARPIVVSLDCPDGRYPSVGLSHPPALRLERAIADLYGVVAEDLPDNRPWLDHGRWGVRRPLRDCAPDAATGDAYAFLTAEGPPMHQIPVGPVHAGIIEPGHFRFTAHGETVVRLEERLGYVHKGVEALMKGVPSTRAAAIAARVSGDSTVAYSLAFSLAVESALRVQAPPRAVWLRAIMAELERLANHFGDIGAICNDAAFPLMQAHCAALRERALRCADGCFGHRLMMDRITPGGVAQDLDDKGVALLRGLVIDVRKHFPKLIGLYENTASLQDRTVATGTLDATLAAAFGAGGYVGRASGRTFDARKNPAYAPYDDLAFKAPTRDRGDVDARVWIRIEEVDQSLLLIEQCLGRMPSGPVRIGLDGGSREGDAMEGVALVEGFRGDIFAWVRLAENGTIVHCHLRDPSWFQWPLLEAVIEDNIVADFPLCNKSFNCSYSGHDL